MPQARVFTLGHSTHSLQSLVGLLETNEIEAVADVRAHPASRRFPHFAREALKRSLPDAGVRYEHLPELGGRRRSRQDSPHGGWEVEAFRAYADHMGTAEFSAGLERLERLAREMPAAIMCAEGLWWRCHRRLVADALVVRGWTVLHVAPDGGLTEHELPDFAVVSGRRVSYPPAQGELTAG